METSLKGLELSDLGGQKFLGDQCLSIAGAQNAEKFVIRDQIEPGEC